jgi:4'-phosphopantetheinyl transferase
MNSTHDPHFSKPHMATQDGTEFATVDLAFWNNADFIAEASTLQRLLNAEERARARRQHDPQKGLFWSISRARLRQHLAERTHVPPDMLEFDVNAYGKLSIANAVGAPLAFSISHSESYSLLATCSTVSIGVDLEAVKPLQMEEMAWPLSPRERVDLLKVTAGDRDQAFYRYWTLKEAFVKALGLGVSYPLHDFDMSPFDSPPELLRVSGEPDAPVNWSFVADEIRPNLRFALAIEARNARISSDWFE